MNGCSLDNANCSESVANLGTFGTTIDPSLLTVYDGFNKVPDQHFYTTDILEAGKTGYTTQPELVRAYPASDKTPTIVEKETVEYHIPRPEIKIIPKGFECGRCRNRGYIRKTFKVHQRDRCPERGSNSGQ